MITIPQVVEEIIQRQPFLIDMINDGLINHSSLARKIKPEIEEKLYKTVQLGAVVMALKRLKKNLKTKLIIKLPFSNPDILVRSNLMEITAPTKTLNKVKYISRLHSIANEDNLFFAITEGVVETTIITSRDLKKELLKVIDVDNVIAQYQQLSAITIKLNKETVTTPGAYYQILKILAWENINVIEIVSTYTEVTIILDDKDVDRAFSVLKKKL
ncbi:aspartate kinase [Candidatus Roizmanbacteria bacterium CG_4_10_14_0_8_um_filter_36_36]|nr:MAG: aspartate kinase [Candidatus Roizmanbacteria bacterium CG_4_10_14_0_8_um_filter_36_36]